MGNSGEEGWGWDLCIVLSHTTRKHVKLMEASLTSILTIETLKPVKKKKNNFMINIQFFMFVPVEYYDYNPTQK